jgi:hypothetical protein
MRLSGKIVKADNSPRFVPDERPEARLRLTGVPVPMPQGPEVREIDLQKYFPRRMSFECQKYDDKWAWGVQEGSMEIDSDSP